jgi:RNA polymerase sigma-70 factor (ECF subfamily)
MIADVLPDATADIPEQPTTPDAPFAQSDETAGRPSRRNLLDRLDAERRRRERESEYASHALLEKWSSEIDDIDVKHDLHVFEEEFRRSRWTANEAEERAFRLWLEGERQTQAFADALGLGDLPPEEQQREVKRFKDRLIKRLRRLWRPRRP